MRLLYIYIDFTQSGKNREGYRGHKQCELNFSTEYIYTMECNSKEKKNYCLQRKEKTECSKIEQGFWGDERIYNISAIVGENGTGKTTLMHAMISILETICGNNIRNLPFDFACMLQDSDERMYLIYSWLEAEIDTYDISCEKISYYRDNKLLVSFRKTKLVYFSNTISIADIERYKNRVCKNDKNVYTDCLYDCSLVASMIRAQEASNLSSDHRLLERLLENQLITYFAFESYQEARYLFDRNQRDILNQMRDQGYPVPFPRELQLEIISSMEYIKKLETGIQNQYQINNYSKWCQKYDNFSSQSQYKYYAITELSINCVINFLIEVKSEGYSNLIDMMSLKEFTNPESYINIMSCAIDSIVFYGESLSIQNYFETCKKYITFLWNNKKHIQSFWKFDNGRWYIKLGENIDQILQELMIRFVDLNRAVSKNNYFVIYHWGLSSGESILLHMFTKLRYLLQGNIYDEEKTDFITLDSAKKAALAKRKEFITNSFANEKAEKCDSVILFFDEADLSLHPEWQRMFIATLTEFLPRLYECPYYMETNKGCCDIQIILTTHSPLILGDFPSGCVLYLKKDKNGLTIVETSDTLQPFGQNLYTLLKDGFYLRNGTIGALAQKKIKSIIEDIHKIKDLDFNTTLNNYDIERKLDKWVSDLKIHKRKTVKYLPQGILRNKLEEEIEVALAIINQRRNPEQNEKRKQELREDIARLQRQLYILENGEETSQ